MMRIRPHVLAASLAVPRNLLALSAAFLRTKPICVLSRKMTDITDSSSGDNHLPIRILEAVKMQQQVIDWDDRMKLQNGLTLFL